MSRLDIIAKIRRRSFSGYRRNSLELYKKGRILKKIEDMNVYNNRDSLE